MSNVRHRPPLAISRMDLADAAFAGYDFGGPRPRSASSWKRSGSDRLTRRLSLPGLDQASPRDLLFSVQFDPGSDRIVAAYAVEWEPDMVDPPRKPRVY